MSSLSCEESREILQRFLALNTKDEQDVFLQNLIKRNVPSRKRPRLEQPRSRLTYTYHVLHGEQTKEVCRKAFQSLYAVSLKRLKRINKLAYLGVSPKDMRGKSRSANAKSADVLLKVHAHIASFPTQSSHYSGKIIKYLDERLNTKKLWKMYNEKHPNDKVGFTFFFKYFTENFNLKFGQPQVDCCCECEMLTTKIKNSHISDAAKRNAEADLMIHKRRANKFYAKLKLEKENSDPNDYSVGALAFDFMQNLSLPKIPVQDTFYLRQFTVNVFCIHDIKKNTAKFYVYHEGEGKKGANEVCSFLLDYFTNDLPKTVKKLHLYSDNCAGQNKNHTLSKLLLALVEMNIFDDIEQFFPIRGHSFLPCDRDFSQIKKSLNRFDRLYSMRQIITSILHSSKNTSKFQVKLVSASDIIDFKQWWPLLYKRNPISVETRGKQTAKKDKIVFGITNFHHFSYRGTSLGIVKAHTFIDGLVQHTFDLRKRSTCLSLPIQKAYPAGKVPVKQAKVDDLRKLQPYIPQKHMIFFNSLLNWPTRVEDDQENDE